MRKTTTKRPRAVHGSNRPAQQSSATQSGLTVPHSTRVLSDCQSRSILIADANPLCATALDRGLRKDGYDVACASDGWSACRQLFEGQFHAVILEFDLPKMDGITMLKALRRSDPYTHIILVSGTATKIEISEAMESGANEFLRKPFSLAVLQKRLEQVDFHQIGALKLQERQRKQRQQAQLDSWRLQFWFYLRSDRFRRWVALAALMLIASALIGYLVVMAWDKNNSPRRPDPYMERMDELIDAVRKDWGR